MNASMNYVDGNASAGELRRIFAADLTSAQGKCAGLRNDEAFCRGSLVYEMSRHCCALLQLRACTAAPRTRWRPITS